MAWELYVDGSYNSKLDQAAFAFAVIRYNIRFYEQSGVLSNHKELRNVAAEIYAVEMGLNHIFKKPHNHPVIIYYDYTGIEKWATGEWRANYNLTSNYQQYIQEMIQLYNIQFVKVKAHCGNHWNEHVDRLARKAYG